MEIPSYIWRSGDLEKCFYPFGSQYGSEDTEPASIVPKPFNPETWILFQLAEDSIVNAKIYDLTGKQIRIIELGHIPAGNYVETNKAIYWDGKTSDGEIVSSGTYLYQIRAGDYTNTRKMVILK